MFMRSCAMGSARIISCFANITTFWPKKVSSITSKYVNFYRIAQWHNFFSCHISRLNTQKKKAKKCKKRKFGTVKMQLESYPFLGYGYGSFLIERCTKIKASPRQAKENFEACHGVLFTRCPLLVKEHCTCKCMNNGPRWLDANIANTATLHSIAAAWRLCFQARARKKN